MMGVLACSSTSTRLIEDAGESDRDSGMVDAGAPDPGDDAGADAGPPLCDPTALRVFVTSLHYDGDLGGRGGGDSRCKTLADAAGLGAGAKWVAWLSSSARNAIDLLPQNGRWCLVDRSTFVGSRDDLATARLAHAIDMVESGGVAMEVSGAPGTWTGTLANGLAAAQTCDNWTRNGALVLGARGNYKVRNGEWTLWPPTGALPAPPCDTALRLYCFEVP
jgi:hypothetical protein